MGFREVWGVPELCTIMPTEARDRGRGRGAVSRSAQGGWEGRGGYSQLGLGSGDLALVLYDFRFNAVCVRPTGSSYTLSQRTLVIPLWVEPFSLPTKGFNFFQPH